MMLAHNSLSHTKTLGNHLIREVQPTIIGIRNIAAVKFRTSYSRVLDAKLSEFCEFG